MALMADGLRSSHQTGLSLLEPRLEFWESSLGALTDRILDPACVAHTGNGWYPRSSTCCLQWGEGSCFREKLGAAGKEEAQGIWPGSAGSLRI